jgi:hypothetical protein
MSHFTVMVIGAKPEKQLAPFDENLETPRYVKYTKEQLIEKGKKDTENYKNGTYARFLADTEKYKSDCQNQRHIDYLENEFPKKLNRTDEEIYQDEISAYVPKEIGSDGEVYSDYNPKSKWDWYVLGGRWSGLIKLKEGANGKSGQGSLVMQNEAGIDQAKKGDIANFDELITFAVLKDGEWFERGEMGWWGIVHDQKDEELWENELKKMVQGLPDDTLISIFDCHI